MRAAAMALMRGSQSISIDSSLKMAAHAGIT